MAKGQTCLDKFLKPFHHNTIELISGEQKRKSQYTFFAHIYIKELQVNN